MIMKIFELQMNLFDEERSMINRNSGKLKWLILIINFYEKQKLVPQVGCCSTCVDRKWEISHKRKLNHKNRSRNESYEYDSRNEGLQSFDDNIDILNLILKMKIFFKVLKKAKYSYIDKLDDNSDELPPRYWHPRDELRRVQTELYASIHHLSSLHMS